jgi:hypothetical protein
MLLEEVDMGLSSPYSFCAFSFNEWFTGLTVMGRRSLQAA